MKNPTFRAGGVEKTNIEGDCLKSVGGWGGGAGTVCWFMGEASKKDGVVFSRGGLILQCKLWRPFFFSKIFFFEKLWTIHKLSNLLYAEGFPGFLQTSKIESFPYYLQSNIPKRSIFDVCKSLGYASVKFHKPSSISMFNVKNRNTRTRCELCSKLTIKTPEMRMNLTRNVSYVVVRITTQS